MSQLEFLKRIALVSVAVLAWVVARAEPAETSRSILDQVSAFDPAQEDVLRAKIGELEADAGVIPTVEIVNLPPDQTIETFADQEFKNLGVNARASDDRMLIVLAPAVAQARMAIGQGLENLLPEATRSRLLNEVLLPAVAKGQVLEGLNETLDVVKEARLARESGANRSVESALEKRGASAGAKHRLGGMIFFVNLVPSLLLFLVWAGRRRSRRHLKLTRVLQVIFVFNVLMGAAFASIVAGAVGPELRFMIAMNSIFNPVVCGLVVLFTYASRQIWPATQDPGPTS